jgi:catechol 2,3-dioxygenase-like lactoylglutathione lyase family enzyme
MINSRVSLDHSGYTVPNLDEAVSFFVDVFGFEVVLNGGPYENCGYIWPGETEPEKATLRLAVLQLGGHANIELLEYTGTPKIRGNTDAPRPSEPGGAHLAFYVENIYDAESDLRDRDDVTFLAGVEVEQGGPIDGTAWAYLMTSWGLVIELIRWNPGLPYERSTSARLVSPPWFTGSSEFRVR